MTETETQITRDDLEQSFRTLKEDFERSTDEARSRLIPAAVFGVIVLAILTYLIGKRVGRTQSTVVEIRRI